jgi:predicted anti-sigma-YlaC factor YlaD
MSCKDFEKEWIENGTEGLSLSSRRHLQMCNACRNLADGMNELEHELDRVSPVRMPEQLKRDILNRAVNPYPWSQFTLNILAILAFIPLVLFNIYPIAGLLGSVYIKLTTILLTSPLLSITGMILITGTIITIPLIKNRF